MQVKIIAECSFILLTFIKLPFVIKIFVLSIFEWMFYTGFTEEVTFVSEHVFTGVYCVWAQQTHGRRLADVKRQTFHSSARNNPNLERASNSSQSTRPSG